MNTLAGKEQTPTSTASPVSLITMYCGCRTCCSRCTWIISVILLLGAAVGLALGLYYTVPCTRTLVQCQGMRGIMINGTQIITDKKCWSDYWQCTSGAGGRALGLYFFLAVAGAGCLLLSLLTCCCFCCQKSPAHKGAQKAHQEQFIQGTTTTAPLQAAAPGDTAVYSDQYTAYSEYPQVKPSVAHV